MGSYRLLNQARRIGDEEGAVLLVIHLSPPFLPLHRHRRNCANVHCSRKPSTRDDNVVDDVLFGEPRVVATIADSDDDSQMVYSYASVISGFAARLTESELKSMQAKDGFVQAYADQTFTVDTTHSPSFLGLNREPGNFWNESGFGLGIIVGVLDTGILPTHPSFGDRGMPPPPSRWKGACEFVASECNNKLIGARVLVKAAVAKGNVSGPITPIDRVGHGTHTASTAVGRFVHNASALGEAIGTAAGLAPLAHVAMYKVCLTEECEGSDMLAGIDAAIEDGVDVLSISLGGKPAPFFENPIAVGSLAAVEKGIFVSCSAGNSGPNVSTVTNDAPWITTVGASTTDRSIRTALKLGNGEVLDGKSLFQTNESSLAALRVVYPGALDPGSAFCGNTSFDNLDVRGKMVVCDFGGGVTRIDKGVNVKKAGGVAMIIANLADEAFTILAEAHMLPTVHLTFADASKVKAYVNGTSNATATIVPKGTVFGEGPTAPMVAHFSSRGPSLISTGIPKPDIIGPGVDVLAAWPLLPIGPSNAASPFNVISGTSMSAPHISGIAALIKSAHPDWSPAMIKSAIMTTADTINAAGEPIADYTLRPASVFARGAGHVSPTKARNPGLVYDIKPEDYVGYMCGISFTDEQVSFVARREVSCAGARKIVDAELNYPSFWVALGPSNNFMRTVNRTVTNVGKSNMVYKVGIVPPPGVAVTVTPEELDFSKADDSVATYSVKFSRSGGSGAAEGSVQYSEGSITWLSSEKSIAVASPVAITFE